MTIAGGTALSREEIERLMEESWIVRIATHGPGKRINLTPLWFCWAGGNVYAYTRGQKIRNLRRNPICSLTVDRNERYPELQGVMWEGTARGVLKNCRQQTCRRQTTDAGVWYRRSWICYLSVCCVVSGRF